MNVPGGQQPGSSGQVPPNPGMPLQQPPHQQAQYQQQQQQQQRNQGQGGGHLPHQGLNGGWQSDKDVNERRKMIAKMYVYINCNAMACVVVR